MMLGARTGAWAQSGGGVPTARDYVQDGLVAMWDGIENAGFGVHDSTATVWKDLVGSYDLMLLSGTTWTENAAVAGSENGIARRETELDVSLFGTIEICANCRSAGQLMCNRSSASNSTHIGYDSIDPLDRFAGMTYKRSDGTSNSKKITDSVYGEYSMTVSIVLNQSAYLENSYINGDMQSTTKEPYGHGSFGGGFTIGSSANGYFEHITGMLANSIRIYSRALTTEEISANYAVDKARFNLP